MNAKSLIFTIVSVLVTSQCTVLNVDEIEQKIEPKQASQVTLPMNDARMVAEQKRRSHQFLNELTRTNKLLDIPLNLTRPDPFAKFPDDLYQVMRRGFTFDVTLENSRIDAQLRQYSRHQSYIDRISARASRYMFYIVNELQKRNLPLDLALLPIVESAFDPFAYSHGRASGMWQFIPSTGEMYGLKQTWWYDGRRDVVASTHAALDYLEDLNRMFDGDWLLALASYNSGPGTVFKAQRRNRAQGKPTDFWNLDLPKETEAYVPKMFALAKIFYAPDQYGLTLPYVSTEPYFAIVETGGQIDLAEAAKLADMDVNDIYMLNPGFNRWATSPNGPHQLLVLKEKEQLFKTNIATLPPEKRFKWVRHTIQNGESLISISNQYNITPSIIRSVNSLSGNLIRSGDVLLIPVASKDSQVYSLSADNRLATQQNAAQSSGKRRTDYQVKPGDTFWDLSKTFSVSVQSLARWNNMAPGDPLQAGQTIAIWQAQPVNAAPAANNREVVRKVIYSVRSGDSLSSIGQRFKVKVADIKKWNVTGRYLQPGERLTLYVDVTQ